MWPLRASGGMSVSRYGMRVLGRAICKKRHFERTGFSLLTGVRIYSIIYKLPVSTRREERGRLA